MDAKAQTHPVVYRAYARLGQRWGVCAPAFAMRKVDPVLPISVKGTTTESVL
jgi:hypothetical protein